MNPPRSNPPYENGPKRPKDVPRLTAWPESPRIDAQQAAANKYNEAAQTHVGKAHGKAAIRADLENARGRPPEQPQAREHAAAPENATLKGKAGIKADMYKAMQSQPQQSAPSRDGGRSR